MTDPERLVREHFGLMASGGNLELANRNVTGNFVNRRSNDEPLDARVAGPEGIKATARWLQSTFADLRWDIVELHVNGNRVVARVVMRGRQTGPFVIHDSPDGRITEVFPATGREIQVPQVHFFTIEAGAIAEHDAVRDDLTMAKQAGWIPPRPAYIVKMLLQKRRLAKQYAGP